MSASTATDAEHGAVANDYPFSRVPRSQRYGWFSIAIQRFGQISALSQFLLGAALGFSLTFWESFWAITIGSVIIEVLCIFVGIIGVKEGLNTSLLTRWTGFGSGGSALIGLTIAISLIGWFGIQSGVSAAGLHGIMPGLPIWAWSVIFGLIVTAVVLLGFHGMQWVANLAVPSFLIVVGWAVVAELNRHDFGELVTGPPPQPGMTVVQGATLVAGAFIAGALITPDMSRFNRTPADVVKQTVVGLTLGEYAVGLSGVLLAHAIKSADINAIIMSSVGWVGIVVIVMGTIKINDWNLYAGGLGFVNAINAITGKKLSRPVMTGVVGVVGTGLAAAGILDLFTGFLTVLSAIFPPLIGIILAEYFFIKRWRPELDATRESEQMPPTSPTWVPATLVVWAAAAAVAYFVPLGSSAINGVVLAFVLYFLAGKVNLLRPVGLTVTESGSTAPAAAHDE
ncbi:MAG: cytosine permease [Propionibacteriaceae bacterium]|jgi:cytosine permease|nr:cytosine permease [Propionibacteriaceae bacterium]